MMRAFSLYNLIKVKTFYTLAFKKLKKPHVYVKNQVSL